MAHIGLVLLGLLREILGVYIIAHHSRDLQFYG